MTNTRGQRWKQWQEEYRAVSDLSNVYLNFGPPARNHIHSYEQIYILRIFSFLSRWECFGNYNFYILTANESYDVNLMPPSVVFFLSNESHLIPAALLEAHLVFTPYYPFGSHVAGNVHPIPLGYNGSFVELEMVPILERNHDVFFSGNLHRGRLLFCFFLLLHSVANHFRRFFGRVLGADYLKEQIHFTVSFGGGLNPDKYAAALMNSKIALVPEGHCSDLSFRFFEAAKSGSVIITKQLSPLWYFNAFPGVQLKTWKGLNSILVDLKRNPDLVRRIHEDTLEYYENYCAESSVACQIIEQIDASNGF